MKVNNKIAVLLGIGLLFGALNVNAKQQEQSKELKAVEAKVINSTNKNIDQKRQEIIKEAIQSVQETALALEALDKGDKKRAIDILAKVSGKIDMIIARDPQLKFLPISISQKHIDILETKDMIKSLLYDATKALQNGRVQEARHMLENLGSEIVITTTSIPLATYPSDIKAIAPLIDQGKIKEAKIALQAALNSLVITNQVIPLPIVRATFLLKNAEDLVSNKKRTKEDDKQLQTLLKEASYQLEMAELLGYGSKDDFSTIYKQIDMIKDKIKTKNNGTGWFDKLKQTISNLRVK